jgi:hypothetical protein
MSFFTNTQLFFLRGSGVEQSAFNFMHCTGLAVGLENKDRRKTDG